MELNETALPQKKAIERCGSLGYQFVEHFDKVWNDTDNSTKKHHALEMQAWYNQVKSITLTHNNKQLTTWQLWEWFFTAGSTPTVLFSNEEEAELYVEFGELVLNEDYNIAEALIELNLMEEI